jgi:hypothetical protein
MLCPSGAGFISALLVILIPVAAFAQAAGDGASGTLQIAKNRFTVKNVFAVMEPDVLAGGDKEKLTVLLSDIALPDELHKASNAWRMWVSEQAVAGTIHGLVVTIDPATGVWDGGHVITSQGFMFYSESITGDQARNLHFEKSGTIGARAEGKVSMKEPMNGMSDEDGPWSIDAEFHCAVVRRPAVTSALTGAAGLDSPPYKAAMVFLAACRKKDINAIRDAVDPQSRASMMKMFAGDNKEEALNMFAQMAEQTATFKLTKVTIRGDSADVEFADPKPGSGNSETLHLVLGAGEWKIAQ